MSLNKNELKKKVSTMEKIFIVQESKKLAKKYKKWILIGSAIVKNKKKSNS